MLVFVPEGQRESTEIPVDLQDRWVTKLLGVCCDLFGGATAYGRGVGVWKEERTGRGHWDRVTVIESWIDPDLPQLEGKMNKLGEALEEMRKKLGQKEVVYIRDGRWKVLRERSEM